MKDLAPALYTKLTGSATLTGKLASNTSVYHQTIPQGASLPCVVFNLQAGTDNYTLKARSWRDRLVQVKGIAASPGDAPDTTAADDIAAAIDSLLTDGTLTITGATLLVMRRVSDVSYMEKTDAGLVAHAGGLYRIGTA